ncbi:MAG TPA: endolysin [Hyphomonas sp.]|nr:endolysin [Hyphomonas sp.]
MYQLSRRSFERLKGVHGDLSLVMCRAINLATTDFGIFEGLRTLEKQQQYLAAGKSKTLDSRHLTGDAVDVFAWHEGKYRPELGYYIDIAHSIQQAAEELKVSVTWGACWMPLNEITDLQGAIVAYSERKKNAGRKPFIDAGHFELTR